jgi:serine phosphatase RsbU (regulator of sigma subunit)
MGRRARSRSVDTTCWVAAVQQVLDGMPGSHVAMRPLADGSDFVIVAASPEVRDVSGRRGTEVVGLRVREAYPMTVDGEVWRAWWEVAAGGAAREVGPVTYVGAADASAEKMTFQVTIGPVGDGVLSSWVRQDERTRLAERVAQTERLGHVGWGEVDLVTGETVWSDEVYRIFERDPALGPLSSTEQQALTVPEDLPVHEQAAERFDRGEAVHLAYRIRVGRRVKHLRAILDAVRDIHGHPLRVYGIVQDVTAQETSRAQLADAEHRLVEQGASLAAESRLAVRLQQIVLPIPDGPIDLPGLRVAVRYLPAERANRVGGDWYHAAVTRDGEVVLAVGDIAGHGIQAATAMAQVRHLLAGLVVTVTSDPVALLGHLNQLLYAMDITATAVIGRYDPVTRVLVWAQAGHPAPLHARAGTTTALERPAGRLLGGLPDTAFGSATLTLDPGDVLLMYTDGLLERRDRSIADGLAAAVETLTRVSAGSAQPLVDLLDGLRPANPDDDTCLLAARPA